MKEVSWCLRTPVLFGTSVLRLSYLILEVFLHSKQISDLLVVDLKERRLKRNKSSLVIYDLSSHKEDNIFPKPEVCTPTFSPWASAVLQISAWLSCKTHNCFLTTPSNPIFKSSPALILTFVTCNKTPRHGIINTWKSYLQGLSGVITHFNPLSWYFHHYQNKPYHQHHLQLHATLPP